MVTTPNSYGMTAMRHMQDFAPDKYAAISDPASYFTDVGDQVLAEIATAMASWDRRHKNEPADEDRRNLARIEAEEIALSRNRTPPSYRPPIPMRRSIGLDGHSPAT